MPTTFQFILSFKQLQLRRRNNEKDQRQLLKRVDYDIWYSLQVIAIQNVNQNLGSQRSTEK